MRNKKTSTAALGSVRKWLDSSSPCVPGYPAAQEGRARTFYGVALWQSKRDSSLGRLRSE